MTEQNTPATTRPNTNPFTLTQDLARECYERYKADYEGRHHTTLDPWNKLPREIQSRWASALKPVAEQLCRVVSLEEELQDARGFLDKLQSTENRASARLSRLEDAVYDARRVLPDMIALGSVPAPLVALLANFATALEEAQASVPEPPVAT